MPHETSLIATVAVGFVLAFALGYAASRLRLPPLVGYLLAGIVIGPFTPGFVADSGIASQLAEMGVILLMFGVGLHFSASDLMAVRWIAIPGAVGQIVIATIIGAVMSLGWGWSIEASVIFGLALSVASTVVLLRALEDRSALEDPNGRIAIGWLIVEDLAMVLALVLLPAFIGAMGGAGGVGADGHEHVALAAPSSENLILTLAITLGKVAAFVAIALLLGPRVVPWILGRVARTGSRELFTLSVLAVSVGIAYASAELFGVSFALGAFFAGVILSESDFSHKAARDSVPLQDAFAVLFFVSVGMLFDPSIVVRAPLSVVAVLALILFGKSIAAFLIVLALRYPIGTALTVSASLAQIGEFSFILAGLGTSFGVLPPEGRDLIIAGALLSISLNPLIFWATDRLQGVGAPERTAPRSSWWTTFGTQRFAALQVELQKTRQRMEAREATRGLKLRELVKNFPIFAELDAEQLQELLFLFQPRSSPPGERLIRVGDRADAMFFIAKGAVEVAVAGAKIRLGPGDYFGEMALLSRTRRTADVTAIEYCDFLTLDQAEFRQFIARHPGVRAQIDRIATARSEDNRRRLEAQLLHGDANVTEKAE